MSASVRLMIQGHSARRASSRVRQCHQLIKISEIKSESYTVIQLMACCAPPNIPNGSRKRAAAPVAHGLDNDVQRLQPSKGPDAARVALL
jgi:hypothetical protein